MNHIIECGDTLQLIEQIPHESIDLLVTSPPYWAKRIYNGKGEIGSEDTPEAYVKRLADFFDTLKPYLKPSANVFINVGDTYFGSGAGAWNKYLDENGNITQAQKERKEKYFTTKPLQPKIKRKTVSKQTAAADSLTVRNRNAGKRLASQRRHYLAET